ncbi:hypothetical protein F4778DRAFT_398521 [Xylariomycetidae sp. FL2044]|nr:hypothetical protein F4778DRAFT_398521 [Xylariomycetidae sp. FL2044]
MSPAGSEHVLRDSSSFHLGRSWVASRRGRASTTVVQLGFAHLAPSSASLSTCVSALHLGYLGILGKIVYIGIIVPRLVLLLRSSLAIRHHLSHSPFATSNNSCPTTIRHSWTLLYSHIQLSHVTNAPGKRCPTCLENGTEVWILPGRCCGYCGTYVG